MRKQHCASGGKTLKLRLANMLQVGCLPLPEPLRVRGQWADAGRSAHWERFASPGPPSTCLKPRNTEIPLFPKTLSRGIARARTRAKSRFFDRPYNPRMLTQLSLTRTNPVKAEANPETGRANTLRDVCRSSRWPFGGMAAMGRLLGRGSKGFQLTSRVRVSGVKRMGTIHRHWRVRAVTGSSAWERGSQLQCVTVRGPLLDGCMGPAEIISREIAGNRRGTGGSTRWLVSLWR